MLDSSELNGNVQETWDRIAGWWDEKIGPEGNSFHRTLIEPITLEMLGLRTGEDVLEIACGNGAFARRMAAEGVTVLATDFSTEFLKRAREHRTDYPDRTEYRLLDATDSEGLAALGRERFDAIVCNMALMDMAEIDPLMTAVQRLLKPGGRFVFSVMHPCFNSNGCRMGVEIEDRNGELVEVYSIRVARYGTPWVERGVGIVGQPVPHFYFNRPLNVLLGSCFRAGLTIDRLEEPRYPENAESSRWSSWANFHEIPPALIVRARRT